MANKRKKRAKPQFRTTKGEWGGVQIMGEPNRLSPAATRQIMTRCFGRYWRNRLSNFMGIRPETAQKWNTRGMPLKQWARFSAKFMVAQKMLEMDVLFITHQTVDSEYTDRIAPPPVVGHALEEVFSGIEW